MSYSYLNDIPDQTIDGKLIPLYPPGTDHCIVAQNVDFLLYPHVKPKGEVFYHCGLYLSERDIFIPDVAVLLDGGVCSEYYVLSPPDLVVEVLSPSTGRYDRTIKKETYARAGVREYWIVDPGNRVVEVYHPQEGSRELDGYYITPASLDEVDEKRRSEFFTEFRCLIFPDLTIRLDDIFADMLPQ